MINDDKLKFKKHRLVQTRLDVFILVICLALGAISIFCLPLLIGIITLAAVTVGYIIYSIIYFHACDPDIPAELFADCLYFRMMTVAGIGVLCITYIVVFSAEYDTIIKATTPVEATVISVQDPDARTQLTLEYLDSQGTIQMASLRVRGRDADYSIGDTVQIKYSQTNPKLICTGDITPDSPLFTLYTSKVNPYIVNRS